MDGSGGAALARIWWQALATGGVAPGGGPGGPMMLPGLVTQLEEALVAETFDASAGSRVGAALWGAGLTHPGVPVVSAQVLHGLADASPHPDAHRRLAGLLAALGQGHQVQRSRSRAAGEEHDDQDTRFRVLFDNAAVAIAIGDTDGVLLEANRALADMIGTKPNDLRGISVYDFAHPDDRERIRTLLYEQLVPTGEGTVTLDQRLVRADGSVGWMAFAITFVRGAGGRPDYLLAVGADVTERHLLQQELHHQARHDSLTGLPNRRYLLEHIEHLITTAGNDDRVGLCFADLDHFKQVNDLYGHSAGDRVLVAVADRIAETLQPDGSFVCRLGGDEFLALIPPPADEIQVAEVANRLLTALSEPIVVDDVPLDISASIGVVVTPLEHADAESLLHAADTSLHAAKRDSKGQWVMQSE
ncbi:diguanylate cyclase domain-containing protein [Nocardia asteroides]|uniref:diguanylate cyclase domain-containing protein n=1 Tax=Nocardia asteroides TaxID=1824 RepID=UPI001E438102|nr:diguanylate cyclase [Nocardia asteroides]UGT61101.1 diguanylate cyclase [Nocardia asteroides]